jgi:hypothetical protein
MIAGTVQRRTREPQDFRIVGLINELSHIVSGEGFCNEKLLKYITLDNNLAFAHIKTKLKGLEQFGSGVSKKMKLGL